jgi:hypothetical protein
MEKPAIPNTMPFHSSSFTANNQFAHRSEVIDQLSRAPVKVRHWLLANVTFQAGLDALNPVSSAWMNDERVRVHIKTGLVRMIECAVDFVHAFPDAQIPKV